MSINRYGCLEIGTRVRLSGTNKVGVVLQSFGNPVLSIATRKGKMGELQPLEVETESKVKFEDGTEHTYSIYMLEILN